MSQTSRADRQPDFFEVREAYTNRFVEDHDDEQSALWAMHTLNSRAEADGFSTRYVVKPVRLRCD